MSKQSWYGGETEALSIRTSETKQKSWYGGPSASLMVTFLLGVAVGFFLCYALLELRKDSPAGESAAVPAEAPAAPEPAPETPPAEADLAAAPADPEEVWPARHLIIGFEGTVLDQDTADMMNRYRPGGVWLRESNTVDAAQIGGLIRQINSLAALEQRPDALPLIAASQEGGSNRNVLRFPEALSYEDLARLETLEAIREAGRATAQQALGLGVGVLLAPVLDIFDAEERDAAERPYFLGDTPETVTQAGIAYAEGLQEGGILAVARHYPGTGSAISKEDDVALIAETNVEELAATMMPFLEAAAYDISGMLVSSATVPALDVQMPGRPASLSPVLVREVFRNKWGYSGVLIAEDIRSVSKWSGKPLEEDIVEALAAGCDAVLVSDITVEEMEKVTSTLKQAVADGRIDGENLLASRQRLDLWRQKLARGTAGTAEPAPAPAAAAEGETEGGFTVEGEVQMPAEGEGEVTMEVAPDVQAEGEIQAEGEAQAGLEQAPEPAPEIEPEKKAPEVKASAPAAPKAAQPEGTRKVVHEIKRGDTLTKIANSHGVSVKNIMDWNGITDPNIKFGEKLVIYTSKPEAAPAPAEAPAPAPPQPEPAPEPAAPPAEAPGPPAAAPEAVPAPAVEPETPPAPAELPESRELPQEPASPAETPEAAGADVMPIEPASETDAAPAETERPVSRNFNLKSGSENESEADAPAEDTTAAEPPAEEAPAETAAVPEMSVTVIPVDEVVVEPPAPVEETSAPAAPALEPPLPAPSAASPEPEYTFHVVQPGDNLSRIANTYGTTAKDLMSLNGITDANLVKLGTELKVPKK